MTAAGETTGRSTLTGGAWTSLSYALPQIYTVVLSVVAARYLGPAGMGQQSFIAWTALSVTTLVTTGLAGTLQRYIAELRGRGRTDQGMGLLHGVLKITYGTALIGGGALIAIGTTRGELQSAWFFAGIAVLPRSFTLSRTLFCSATSVSEEATIAGLVTGGFGVVATIVVLAMGAGIPGIFAVEAVGATVALIWLTVLGRKLIAGAPPPSPLGDLKPAVMRYVGYSSLIGVLVLVVDRRSEFLALEAFSTAEEIAFYSIAFGGVTALVRLIEGATAPIVSVVATLFGAGDRSGSTPVSRAVCG